MKRRSIGILLIDMEIPYRLEIDENTEKTKTCRLKKSLYGPKVCPKRWNEKFSKNEELKKFGFKNTINGLHLFTLRKERKVARIVLYVN